jgi:lysozyme family protein
MAEFLTAAAFVLEEEGGYEPPSAADPGGETNYGISKRAYPDEDIKNMTPGMAKAIYRADFWRFDNVNDQDVANKLLDLTVNLGLARGVRLAQQALVYFFPGKVMMTDGVFGPAMLALINACPPAKLLRELRARQSQRYCADVSKNPAEAPLALGLFRRAAR